MKPVISIGNQDFKAMREHNCFYIDKTNFIKEWWENEDYVTLITRPRRFGKTLNINTIECFFSNQYSNRSDLFEHLSIWEEEKYQKLQGTYPVIFLSFSGVNGDTFVSIKAKIMDIIIDLYTKFDFLQQSNVLNAKEKEYLNYVNDTMSENKIQRALYRLSFCLSRHYNKKVIILLDEYDVPMQEAYINGYWDEIVSFIRSLFNFTFKTNPYLERGLITGITRISKESIFSDLNNLEVITTTSKKYATCFGFTEREVKHSLELFDLSSQIDKVKKWYDGFQFGNQKEIYNPWSIIKYLESEKFQTYWVNTSGNHLVGKLIREGSTEIKTAMEDLLMGKPLMTHLDEEIVFNQLEENDTAIWSLLLASGYLKVENIVTDENNEDDSYQLSFTNFEVQKMFKKMILGWFDKSTLQYNDFVKALLLQGDNMV